MEHLKTSPRKQLACMQLKIHCNHLLITIITNAVFIIVAILYDIEDDNEYILDYIRM